MENLAQPNLDGISCIISNIQFHLEKKPDKSPERERERENKISCSSRRLFRCWTPRHLLFRYFSYQVDKGLRCLTPSLAHLFSGCANTVFHFGSPLSFLTTISPSLSASSFLSRRTFLLGDTQTRRISRENSSNSHGRGLDKVESLEVSFYCSYVQSG